MVTLEDILNTYFGSDVCIGETLADIPADGLSLEDAHQLYMKTMNKVEEDISSDLLTVRFKFLQVTRKFIRMLWMNL